MIRIAVLFCLALIPARAFTQASFLVKGSIQGTDGSLPGATVRIQSDNSGAVADPDGNYQLELPAGQSLTLEYRFAGYKPFTHTLMGSAGETRQLDVELQESSLNLDEVVVTGTLSPTYVTQSPVKVEVITSKYLELFIPAAASSIVEGVTLVNGVQEVVACGVCFTNSISINGLPGPYTAVLMDGTPMYGNLASVYGLNGIPNMIIDRFEVIKGPSSTLYGSEAVAGVINIITKNPEDQPRLAVDVMGTSHLESFGNLAATSRLGNFRGFTGLNWAYIGDYDDDNGDGFGDMINMDRYSLFSKWQLDRKSGKKFSLAAKYYYEDRRNGVEQFLTNRNYRQLRGSEEVYGESIYTNRAELFGRYEFAGRQNLSLDYSLSYHHQDSYYGADHYRAKQQIAYANLIWNKVLNQHTLTSGLTTRYQYYDDNTVATQNRDGSNHSDYQYIPGIFAQDEWEMSPKFTLLAGARLDHYQAHGLILAPRLNAKYMLSDFTSLRTNFGTGFRVVNLFTEDHAFITGQRSVEVVEALQPEQSYNASLNLNHFYSLGRGQGTLDVDAFYTYFTNKIIPDYSQEGKIIYANSSGYAQSRGLGFNWQHEFGFPFSFNVGANRQLVTETEPDEQGQNQSRAIEYAPRWTGVATANYRFRKPKITLSYTLRLTGPMQLPEVYDLDDNGNPLPQARPTTSKAFAFQNIQVQKELNRQFSLYGGIQNLFNYKQPWSPLAGYNDPNAAPGFSSFFDTGYAYSPIHGRELYLGVKWNLD